MSSSSMPVVWIFLVSHYLQCSYGNTALPQTHKVFSSGLITRDVGLSNPFFNSSADTTDSDENLYLNGLAVTDDPKFNNLADANSVAFDSLGMDLFATDPTSNLLSNLVSEPELDDSLVPAVTDSSLISAHCPPNYNRKSRKRENGLTCSPGQQLQSPTLSLPNLHLDDEEDKPEDFEDGPTVITTEGYPKKCPNGWFPFGRVIGVACDGPLSLFRLNRNDRMIFAYIEKCNIGKQK